jgi:hypothetical protein
VPDAAFAHINDLGYITAAWTGTAVVLGVYVAALLHRARRARLRAEAVVARRDRVAPASVRPAPARPTSPDPGS